MFFFHWLMLFPISQHFILSLVFRPFLGILPNLWGLVWFYSQFFWYFSPFFSIPSHSKDVCVFSPCILLFLPIFQYFLLFISIPDCLFHIP